MRCSSSAFCESASRSTPKPSGCTRYSPVMRNAPWLSTSIRRQYSHSNRDRIPQSAQISARLERSLQLQQDALALHPAAVAGERAGGAHDAVARHDHGDRVAAVGHPDGPGAVPGPAQPRGDLAVRRGGAVGDRRAAPPTPPAGTACRGEPAAGRSRSAPRRSTPRAARRLRPGPPRRRRARRSRGSRLRPPRPAPRAPARSPPPPGRRASPRGTRRRSATPSRATSRRGPTGLSTSVQQVLSWTVIGGPLVVRV